MHRKSSVCIALALSIGLSTTPPLLAQDLLPEEKAAGFVSMFNGKDLSGWMYLGKGEGTFSVQDGAIHYKGGNGWLCYTVKEYPDFELRCEFKLIKKGGDGGIFFRASKDTAGANWPSKRYELQVKDYAEQGRLWGVAYKLDKDKVAKLRKPLGEWETYRLIVQGNNVEVYLNGELINTTDAATRREPGYIGLQAEGGEQAFRNLRVRPLAPSPHSSEGSGTRSDSAPSSLALRAPIVPAEKRDAITWKRTVVDNVFRSEGVAVADVNKDGKPDILVGDVWYEAPDWKMHVIREDRSFDPLRYSESFGCFAEDFNGDGWVDLLVIPFPGKRCCWYENPRGKPGPWKEHLVHHTACNETPQYVDLFGTGQRVLIMGTQPKGKDNMGQMCWFRPGKDPTQPWEQYPISEPSQPDKEIPGTRKYAHGLGVGDVNGNGRLDVICTGGWWEQPAKVGGEPWKFHPANLGPNCADMFALDVDGDGHNDIISSSAHDYGIWWHKQVPKEKGSPTFVRHELLPKLFSQSHALHLVDINGNGLKDLVTGRRWWAHGPKGDPGSGEPPYLYWFEAKRRQDGSIDFLPHRIDDDSGIGTQFAIADINGDGLPDIIISNKRGVFVFEQVRGRTED